MLLGIRHFVEIFLLLRSNIIYDNLDVFLKKNVDIFSFFFISTTGLSPSMVQDSAVSFFVFKSLR